MTTREVLRGIACGLSAPEIAAELFLSTHTVRDYIKSVLEKVGVSSRGELTAKLFAEHYSAGSSGPSPEPGSGPVAGSAEPNSRAEPTPSRPPIRSLLAVEGSSAGGSAATVELA